MASEHEKSMREVLEEFINIYKESPCLWQVKSKDYHNKNKREAAYKNLITKLKEIDKNANRDLVVKKINSLRTNIRKEKKKIEDSQRSGAGTDEVYTPTLWYYHLFDFLEDQVTPRSSSSNVINDPDEITEEHPNDDSKRSTDQVDIDDQSQLDHPISTNLTEKSITPKRNPPPRPPKRATPDYYSVLQTIDEHFKKPKIKEDRYDVFAKKISLKLRDITDKNQRLLAEKIINEAIFLAETGQLTFGHSVTTPPQQKRHENSLISPPLGSPPENFYDEYGNDDSNISLVSYVSNFSV